MMRQTAAIADIAAAVALDPDLPAQAEKYGIVGTPAR